MARPLHNWDEKTYFSALRGAEGTALQSQSGVFHESQIRNVKTTKTNQMNHCAVPLSRSARVQFWVSKEQFWWQVRIRFASVGSARVGELQSGPAIRVWARNSRLWEARTTAGFGLYVKFCHLHVLYCIASRKIQRISDELCALTAPWVKNFLSTELCGNLWPH